MEPRMSMKLCPSRTRLRARHTDYCRVLTLTAEVVPGKWSQRQVSQVKLVHHNENGDVGGARQSYETGESSCQRATKSREDGRRRSETYLSPKETQARVKQGQMNAGERDH